MTGAKRRAEFNIDQYRPYMKKGKGKIEGKFCITSDNGKKTCPPDQLVLLNPVTDYSTEWFERYWKNGELLEAPNDEAARRGKMVRTNKYGRFVFRLCRPANITSRPSPVRIRPEIRKKYARLTISAGGQKFLSVLRPNRLKLFWKRYWNMIIDKIEFCSLYTGLNEKFKKAFAFLQAGNFQADGERHEIDGTDIYYVVQEYEARPLEKRHWKRIVFTPISSIFIPGAKKSVTPL